MGVAVAGSNSGRNRGGACAQGQPVRVWGAAVTQSNPGPGHQPPRNAEHIEELVPEGLFLGGLAARAGPVVGELNGAGRPALRNRLNGVGLDIAT
jgi:hypothetical protein